MSPGSAEDKKRGRVTMLPQKENARPLERHEMARILYRETEEQHKRARDLENALAEENYHKVDELMSALEASLSQHPFDSETQLLELRVMKPRHKPRGNQ